MAEQICINYNTITRTCMLGENCGALNVSDELDEHNACTRVYTKESGFKKNTPDVDVSKGLEELDISILDIDKKDED